MITFYEEAKLSAMGLGLTEDEAEMMLEDMGIRDGDFEEGEDEGYDCEFCNDTGKVTVMETVYQGEPHLAPTGTEVCVCRLDIDDADY